MPKARTRRWWARRTRCSREHRTAPTPSASPGPARRARPSAAWATAVGKAAGAAGAAIGGMADRSWKGAGIGGGAGSAVGLATVLLTRGREVELRQGSTIDVVFDRPVTID